MQWILTPSKYHWISQFLCYETKFASSVKLRIQLRIACVCYTDLRLKLKAEEVYPTLHVVHQLVTLLSQSFKSPSRQILLRNKV